VTLEEAALYLNRKESTLRHAIRDGKLAAVKIDGRWRVSEQAVNQYRADSLGKAGRPWKGSKRGN
jgi:excisionase family DNA binding protein